MVLKLAKARESKKETAQVRKEISTEGRRDRKGEGKTKAGLVCGADLGLSPPGPAGWPLWCTIL